MAALPILIMSAIIYALSLTHLISGLATNGTAFGLPANNSAIQVFLAIIFVMLAALMLASPLLVSERNKRFNRRK